MVDDRPLSKLDKRINRLKDNLARVGTLAATGFAAAGYATFQLAEMASNADETIAGIGEVFKANKQAALDWSATTAKALGRSVNTIQKSVFDFGKFLRPTFQNTNVDILEMSENLSKLAVDLASFNDTSFEEAQMRLFSGITGETEAVRRLGINISDEALKAMAAEGGDNRPIAKMSLAEKTQLRYLKILRDSTDAQGDALRSSQRWAGQLERFKAVLKDTGVELGHAVMDVALPALKGLTEALKGSVAAAKFLVKETSNLQAAFVAVTGVIAGRYVIALVDSVRANWDLITSIAHSMKVMALQQGGLWKLASGAAVATVGFLALEDAITFSRGGDSALGKLIEEIAGVTDALGFANEVADLFFATITGNGSEQARLIEARHESKREHQGRAVESGSHDDFVGNKDFKTTRAQAHKQFLEQRQAYLAKNPNKVTKEDYDAGLVSEEVYKSSQNIQAREAVAAGAAPHATMLEPQNIEGQVSTASQAGLKELTAFSANMPKSVSGVPGAGATSNKTVTNNITIQVASDADAKAIVQEQMRVMMRLDYAADGEEN